LFKFRIVKIHIGKLIEEKLNEMGMKKSEFAKRIYKQRQNVNDLLNKESIDTSDLFLISEVLKFDFFAEYSNFLKINKQNNSALDESRKEIEFLKGIIESQKLSLDLLIKKEK
jgi:hypothetical protein